MRRYTMPVNSFELFTSPAHTDPAGFAASVSEWWDEFAVQKPEERSRHQIASERIEKARGWKPSQPLFGSNLAPFLEELGVFYVPKPISIGPAVAFPLYDHERRLTHLRLNPLYELKGSDGNRMKYVKTGKLKDQHDPGLFGQSIQTITNMIKHRSVIFVEGYYDLIACRLMHPGAPVLSTGSKSISDKHRWYCQMAGVRTLHVMLDRDKAGETASKIIRHVVAKKERGLSLEVVEHLCPAPDPSAALQDLRSAKSLKALLYSIYPSAIKEYTEEL
jgi:5S rRNA maturation endonuclease (ribonuclease M5)